MTPEQKTRKVIDKMFSNAGWQVLDRNHYAPNISAVYFNNIFLINTW